MTAVLDFYAFFLFFAIGSIVVHELAHVWYLESLGRKVRIIWNRGLQVGTEKDYKGLSRAQLRNTYLVGIYAGLIPIVIGGLLFYPIYFVWLAPYVAWCRSDIKNAWRNRR